MKKIFMFAVMFAAVSMVACGGQQKKAEAAEECCGECAATEQCCEGECAAEECCGECAVEAEAAEECCGECAAEETVEAEVVEVAE